MSELITAETAIILLQVGITLVLLVVAVSILLWLLGRVFNVKKVTKEERVALVATFSSSVVAASVLSAVFVPLGLLGIVMQIVGLKLVARQSLLMSIVISIIFTTLIFLAYCAVMWAQLHTVRSDMMG